MAKKDLLATALAGFNAQDQKPAQNHAIQGNNATEQAVKANAEATTTTTANALKEAETAVAEPPKDNYSEFNLPHEHITTDLKGKRYKDGDPLHTTRYSFQITAELMDNLTYYMEYAKAHGIEINQSTLLREALAKALKKEPRGKANG